MRLTTPAMATMSAPFRRVGMTFAPKPIGVSPVMTPWSVRVPLSSTRSTSSPYSRNVPRSWATQTGVRAAPGAAYAARTAIGAGAPPVAGAAAVFDPTAAPPGAAVGAHASSDAPSSPTRHTRPSHPRCTLRRGARPSDGGVRSIMGRLSSRGDSVVAATPQHPVYRLRVLPGDPACHPGRDDGRAPRARVPLAACGLPDGLPRHRAGRDPWLLVGPVRDRRRAAVLRGGREGGPLHLSLPQCRAARASLQA